MSVTPNRKYVNSNDAFESWRKPPRGSVDQWTHCKSPWPVHHLLSDPCTPHLTRSCDAMLQDCGYPYCLESYVQWFFKCWSLPLIPAHSSQVNGHRPPWGRTGSTTRNICCGDIGSFLLGTQHPPRQWVPALKTNSALETWQGVTAFGRVTALSFPVVYPFF